MLSPTDHETRTPPETEPPKTITPPPPNVMDEQPITTFRVLLRTSLRLRRRLRKLYNEYGLTGAQYGLMTRIPSEGITLTQLAKTAWADPGNTSGVVDRLEREGWVVRTRSSEDRRVVKVKLSGKGVDLLRTITPQYTEMVSEIMGVLSPNEITVLHELLTKLDSDDLDVFGDSGLAKGVT